MSRTLVVAGPGTGKTHVLAARVQALLDSGAVRDPEDMLVLSFTRAAVAELRRRLADHALARFVRPSTIDAYARRLLSACGGTAAGGFDDIIQRATALAQDSRDSSSFVHVVVDEAQDLVGARRDFVDHLLTRAEGFTVLGDPAQGIYGWQDRSAPTDAIAELHGRFPDAIQLGLTRDYRTRSAAASPLSASRAQVGDGGDEELLTSLRQALRSAPLLESGALALVLRNSGRETAVLARRNGDVLRLSERLCDAGVGHRIQPTAETAAPPAWIAETLWACEAEEVSQDDFWAIDSPVPAADLDRAWSELTRVAGTTEGRVRLSRVRDRAREIAELPARESAFPVISTVHRAKGLEFDRVIVVDFGDRSGEVNAAEESRVLFVAATRARDETLMARIERPTEAMRRRAGRWVATSWRQDTPVAVEMRVGDVDRTSPMLDDGSAAFVQRHIRTRVRAGDPVSVEPRRDLGRGDFVVLHKGLPIARLSSTTCDALLSLGLHRATLGGLVVDRLSTAVGPPAASAAAGAGEAGFWLVPEIAGLGRLR